MIPSDGERRRMKVYHIMPTRVMLPANMVTDENLKISKIAAQTPITTSAAMPSAAGTRRLRAVCRDGLEVSSLVLTRPVVECRCLCPAAFSSSPPPE